MKNSFLQKVYYSDTDAYGVVWHGSYLRWLEMGRMKLCEQIGHTMTEYTQKNVVMPVAEVNIRYKSPAKLEETLRVETELFEASKISMTFLQRIFNSETNQLRIEARIKVVATDNEGNLYRKLPECLDDLILKAKND